MYSCTSIHVHVHIAILSLSVSMCVHMKKPVHVHLYVGILSTVHVLTVTYLHDCTDVMYMYQFTCTCICTGRHVPLSMSGFSPMRLLLLASTRFGFNGLAFHFTFFCQAEVKALQATNEQLRSHGAVHACASSDQLSSVSKQLDTAANNAEHALKSVNSFLTTRVS